MSPGDVIAKRLGLCLVIAAAAAACVSAAGEGSNGQKLKVVATTTIIGDVVNAVGGDAIDLSTLLPAGTDPHSFDPTPQDVAKVSEADIVFVNGAGLEGFIDPMIANAGGSAEIVSLSDGVALREQAGALDADPHVWFDVANVMIWTRNAARMLRAVDVAHADAYATNTRDYLAQLTELDAWIVAQVDSIPVESRLLVTNHDTLGYFADRYGFRILGTVFAATGGEAQPSAQAIADLVRAIELAGVKAVFTENTLNPQLAATIAREAGAQVISRLYTDALGPAGSPASTYIDMMRFDVATIVDALK